LRQTVMGLCAFPTRHTLSGARGVDAAADWLLRRLRSFGGNLSVEKDTWLEPKGQRVDKPSTISNVYAKIPGAKYPNHWVVISGHYDSRVTDVMDSTSD
ncbi:MAG: aminopeptidase, partial [Armatimonadaceae bacterium]